MILKIKAGLEQILKYREPTREADNGTEGGTDRLKKKVTQMEIQRMKREIIESDTYDKKRVKAESESESDNR